MKVKTFTVHKADGCPAAPVESATLVIAGDLPPYPRSSAETADDFVAGARQRLRDDAKTILAALASLPQGTMHELLILLLEKKACVLRIPGDT